MRKIVASLSTLFLFVLLCTAPPAHAVSKEMVQLQTQVQQLQDALQHLQETQDQQMSVMQHVVQQISDSVAHISSTMTTLQQQVQAQNESGGGKIDQVSGQMQGINDSVDALRTRIDKLSAQVAAVQSELQNVATAAAVQQQGGQPAQPGADPNQAPQQQQQQPQAPPVNDLYQGALRDYNSARYDLAAGEFGDVLKYYPQDDLAGNAQFYLGEIAYRQGKYQDAITAYGVVLQQFAGNSKAPAAQLRKGEAELSLDQRDNGIRDLRELIARYPQTPEASQARSRLNGMGVRPTASKPTAYHE